MNRIEIRKGEDANLIIQIRKPIACEPELKQKLIDLLGEMILNFEDENDFLIINLGIFTKFFFTGDKLIFRRGKQEIILPDVHTQIFIRQRIWFEKY